jgi:HSP20 family protein
VHVDVHDGALTISGERHGTSKSEGDTWKRVERFSGSFSRSFAVPRSLKPEDISAKLEKGVLNIVVPPEKDAAAEQASKRVKIA